MFTRRRSQRVHPDVLVQDAYIKRRYEDLSVCIHKDIRNGRGQYNYYAPWLELKLQSFPAFYREQHSVLVEHNLPIKVEPSRKLTPKIDVAKPSVFVSGSVPTDGVLRNAWVQEDKDNELGTESKPMPIPVNKSQRSEAVSTPNLTAEDRGNFPVRVGVRETESIEPEEQSSSVAVQTRHHVSPNSQESQTNSRVTYPDEVNQEEIQEAYSTQTSPPVAHSGSSVRSRLCTIL